LSLVKEVPSLKRAQKIRNIEKLREKVDKIVVIGNVIIFKKRAKNGAGGGERLRK